MSDPIECTVATITAAGQTAAINKIGCYPLTKQAGIVLSNDNKTFSNSIDDNYQDVRGFRGKSSGKWYFEVYFSVSGWIYAGVSSSAKTSRYRYLQSDGQVERDTPYVVLDYGPPGYSHDVVGVAVDIDSGKIWWSANNVWPNDGDPATGLAPAFDDISGTIYPYFAAYFADRPATVRGMDDCEYDPPDGFIYWDGDPLHIIVECTVANIEISSCGVAELPESHIVCDPAQVEVVGLPMTFNGNVWDDAAASINTYFDLSNDNKTVTTTAATYACARAFKPHSTGKWYYEFKLDGPAGTTGLAVCLCGLVSPTYDLSGEGPAWPGDGLKMTFPGNGPGSWGLATNGYQGLYHDVYYDPYGDPPANTSYRGVYPVTYPGDIVGVAVDFDAGKMWYSINGEWIADGDPAAGTLWAFDSIDCEAAPEIMLTSSGVSITLHDYADSVYEPPDMFYHWDYEAPRNETMIIGKLGTIDLSPFKAIIRNDSEAAEEPGIIYASSQNIRVLNFRATVGV